jgi:hypothetical protein
LADLRDPALVAETVAGALRLQDTSLRWLVSTLADFLAPRRLLLILDNCEHLLDACAVLADSLLHTCPDLKVLATSREALGIGGESVVQVPPLPVPQEDPVPRQRRCCATTPYGCLWSGPAPPGHSLTSRRQTPRRSAGCAAAWTACPLPLSWPLFGCAHSPSTRSCSSWISGFGCCPLVAGPAVSGIRACGQRSIGALRYSSGRRRKAFAAPSSNPTLGGWWWRSQPPACGMSARAGGGRGGDRASARL